MSFDLLTQEANMYSVMMPITDEQQEYCHHMPTLVCIWQLFDLGKGLQGDMVLYGNGRYGLQYAYQEIRKLLPGIQPLYQDFKVKFEIAWLHSKTWKALHKKHTWKKVQYPAYCCLSLGERHIAKSCIKLRDRIEVCQPLPSLDNAPPTWSSLSNLSNSLFSIDLMASSLVIPSSLQLRSPIQNT